MRIYPEGPYAAALPKVRTPEETKEHRLKEMVDWALDSFDEAQTMKGPLWILLPALKGLQLSEANHAALRVKQAINDSGWYAAHVEARKAWLAPRRFWLVIEFRV